MGDFLGFTFGDDHSSDLGITRVSDGDRYDEQLHPEIKDRTAEVPGLNGEYYFGSDFGTRTFDLEFAFDHLTEEQFRKLRQVFGTKQIKRLIFDERPYKYYMAKLESPIELSYVCFDEPKRTVGPEQDGVRRIEAPEIIGDATIDSQTAGVVGTATAVGPSGNMTRVREKITPWVYDGTKERIYKGEGKASFICHYPFAKSVFKAISAEDEEADWVSSSGILLEENYTNIIDTYNNGIITVYNPGDIETGFRLYLPSSVIATATSIIYKANNLNETARLELDTMVLNSGDVGVLIDTNNNLIIGVSVAPTIDPEFGTWNYTTSGNIYNQHITSGYFFHLEPTLTTSTIEIAGGSNDIHIFYDYLYF